MRNSNKRCPWAWIPTLAFAEGQTYVIVTALSVVMFMQMGLSDTEVGLYTGWLLLPWVVKPLWSPFLCLLKPRRWWVLAMQALIGASLAGIAFCLPTVFWLQATMCLFFLIAFCSSTHNNSADGFYRNELVGHDRTRFEIMRNMFHDLAFLFVNGFLVMIAGVLQVQYRNQLRFSWALIFYGLAGIFIALWLYHGRFLPRVRESELRRRTAGEVAQETKSAFVSFFRRFSVSETVFGVFFILLFRLPQALLGPMTKTFILRPNSQGGLGLSPQEYGFANGTVGFIGLFLGGFLGSFLVSRGGLRKWLWPMVCALCLPDVVYVYLSYSLNGDLFVVSSCVFVEQLGYGMGIILLFRFMEFFSRGKFSASHYSICMAVSFLGLMLPGMVSGLLKEMLGFRQFFVFVMACCTVSFLVAAFIRVEKRAGESLG